MDAPSPQSTPGKLGPYTLLQKLGQGGMGEVHLAHDTRLTRKVALKLLPADLRSDPERRTRFLREARAAAQLSHPNVAQIYDVGEEGGLDYIAFELVEGKTLADLVAERPLELHEIVELALPLADALSYAHERGIVHRDLKAANVMVSSRGHPKLLDFGLAKILEGSRAPREKTTTLTMQGAIFGTPAAMSPEQALGRTLDARSDVFSFGSLLYEMACGRPAFAGATVMEVMDAVIHREPAPLERLRPELPAEFTAIVAKALRKDASERYQTMSDLAADLRHWKRKTDSGLVPPAAPRRGKRLALALAALALVALAGGAYWLRGRTGGGGARGGTGADARPGELVAVMGFENLSDPDDREATGRMLMSLVATDIAEHGGLRVVSTSKVLASLDEVRGGSGGRFESATASHAARVAGASVMLVGQILRSGSGVMLTAELVDVESGETRGSLHEQAASADAVFALAGSVGKAVRRCLGVEGAAQEFDLQRSLTASPEAYREYNAGELAMNRRDFVVARSFFERAVELDPTFTMAHLRLGMVRDWLGDPRATEDFDRALQHLDRLSDRWRIVCRAAADRSRGAFDQAFLALEPLIEANTDIPEAHNEFGELLHHENEYKDPERARACFARALELDPAFEIVLYHLLRHTLASGDLATARALVGRARKGGKGNFGDVEILYAQGRFAEVVAESERQLEAGTPFEWEIYAEAASRLPDPAVHARAFELWSQTGKAERHWRDLHQARHDFGQGRFGDALAAAARVLADDDNARHRPEGGLLAARIHFWIGEPAQAERAARDTLALDEFEFGAWSVLGACQLATGRISEAAGTLADMRATLARSRNQVGPSSVDALEALVAAARGEHAEARRAIERSSARPRIYRHALDEDFAAARAAEAAGDLASARAAWLRLAEPDPLMGWDRFEIVVPALYELGRLEQQLGELDAAREHLRRFLERWGRSDRSLPSVEDARRRLAELDPK